MLSASIDLRSGGSQKGQLCLCSGYVFVLIYTPWAAATRRAFRQVGVDMGKSFSAIGVGYPAL
ncbi:hypothetical protein EMIT0P265_310002 [Pseudomonas zeae]